MSALHLTRYKGGTGYTDAKIAAILCDFLQPDTRLSHDEVIASILPLIPENATASAEVGSFSEMCVELAEQIPYQHPSQLKFAAQLLSQLGKSPKFTSKYPIKGSSEILYGKYQRFREALADATGLDEAFPFDWININAFEAKLCAMGTWGAHAGPVWIIWNGQTMFSFIIYEEDIEDTHMCAVGDIGDAAPFQPRSVERWRYWTRKFEEVEAWPEATDECKGLSSRAARLMLVLEENMVFSV
ncbi:hypothetical protein SCUCBS95973_005310 [Sporothrix curviconia]|uniref:Uncharacterized protein n=1 Tax=Sporothrix curviconia TaxID=1260050 RepID=A0ABP0BWP3_9PEZI